MTNKIKPGQLVRMREEYVRTMAGGWACNKNGRLIVNVNSAPQWKTVSGEIGIFIKETSEHEWSASSWNNDEPMHIVLFGETLVIVAKNLLEPV